MYEEIEEILWGYNFDPLQAGLASFCLFVKKPVFSMEKNRPGKNSFCRVEKTTRQKPGKISFANIYQVEKIDF
jgi:hypothetical protein